jgi:hypothetical protein
MPAPVLAAPLVIPFAEAIGVSIAALGMAKATDKVNEFIQENPEDSIKIFQMIMPSQGIANILKNESSEGDEDLSEDMDEEVEVEKDTRSKKEIVLEEVARGRAGRGNFSSPDAVGPAVSITGNVKRGLRDAGKIRKGPDPNYDASKKFQGYKRFIRPKKADGGAIGIEVLFGPKRDNFRYGGDTMGGKNDKSKSSPGPDSSKVSAQQQSNHEQAMAAAQNDGPSFKDKVKSVITNPATQALGGAILTGGINLAIPGALDKLNKASMIKNAIDYARYVAPDEAIEGELENIQTQGGIVPYADGGRVGLFMGGSPLTGQALAIYNSMNAYGFDDQAIADALSAQGLYTAGGTTDTPDTTIQPIGFQSSNGGGGGGITELNPLNRPKGTPFDLNSLTKTKFGYNNALGRTIEGVKDFTGSMIDKFSGSKIGEGIKSGATKFKNMAFTPMMALMQKRNPLNPSATNYNPNLQKQMDFLEGTTGTRVFGTSDNLQFEDAAMIGRDPNSGLAKYGPGSVLSGQNVVSGFGTNDYEQQLANYISKMKTYKNLTNFQKEKLEQAKAEVAKEIARREQETADRARAANPGVYARADAMGFTDGKGGGFGSKSTGTNDAFSNESGRGRTGYSDGGLVTMFKEKR